MASAAREYRYAHREFSTNGSLARDLDWAVRERELEHAGEVPRHERTQAAPKVYHKEQVLVRERQAIDVYKRQGRWAEELRRSYHEEACSGLNYARTADGTTDVCLVKLLNELSEDEYRHAERLMVCLLYTSYGRRR